MSLRDGFIGAALGFLIGLAGVGLLMYAKPFGEHVVPAFVYAILVGVATLFGAWEGGLVGIDSEHKKLAKFHDDLVAGKYLDIGLCPQASGTGGAQHDAGKASGRRIGGDRFALRQSVQHA